VTRREIGAVEKEIPDLPGWLRLTLLLVLVVIGSAVVVGITDALRTLVHGGGQPTAPAR